MFANDTFTYLGLSVVALLLYRYIAGVSYPTNLPLAGEAAGRCWFTLKTRWRYYTDCGALYRETFERFSKIQKTALLPGLGFRHDIVLPHNAVPWILSQPESSLSHTEAIQEIVQLVSSLGHGRYKADQWPMKLIKTDINGALENVAASVRDELAVACDRYFGLDTDCSRNVELLLSMKSLAAQVASRFMVGKPLCRDPQYLSTCLSCVDGMALNAGAVGALPRVVRPILGPLLTWKLHQHVGKLSHYVRDLQERLIRDEASRHLLGESSEQQPDSLFHLMINFAKHNRPEELEDLSILTRRLCFTNFASIHQSSIFFTNLLLNIAASDAEYGTIAALRDELHQVLGPNRHDAPFRWTKRHVAELVKLDSVARETLRLHAINSRQLFRKVMREGVETEDGIMLPKNSTISILAHPAQVDANVYEDPFEFVPFRFSEARKSKEQRNSGLSFVSTSLDYLAFGHPPHSCPGRFLVDFETKMLVTYIIDSYDVSLPDKYRGIRPQNRWIAEAYLPPSDAQLTFHRREKPS